MRFFGVNEIGQLSAGSIGEVFRPAESGGGLVGERGGDDEGTCSLDFYTTICWSMGKPCLAEAGNGAGVERLAQGDRDLAIGVGCAAVGDSGYWDAGAQFWGI